MVSREDRRDAEGSITRLMHLYTHRLDAADFDGFSSLFEKATWRISPDRTCRGKDEVRAWLDQNLIVHGDRLGTLAA